MQFLQNLCCKSFPKYVPYLMSGTVIELSAILVAKMTCEQQQQQQQNLYLYMMG